MLPSKHRITKKSFKDVLSRGKTFHSDYIYVKIAPISADPSIFTCVVSLKVSKKAVERNKLKRRARYIIRKVMPEIKKAQGIIVFFRKGSEKLNFQELEREIIGIFKKAKILLL